MEIVSGWDMTVYHAHTDDDVFKGFTLRESTWSDWCCFPYHLAGPSVAVITHFSLFHGIAYVAS